MKINQNYILVVRIILPILITAKIGIVIVANLVASPALPLALPLVLTSLGSLMSLGFLTSLGYLRLRWMIVSLVAEMLLEVLIDWPVAYKVIEEIMVFPSLQNMGQFARTRGQNKTYHLSNMSNLFSILTTPT